MGAARTIASLALLSLVCGCTDKTGDIEDKASSSKPVAAESSDAAVANTAPAPSPITVAPESGTHLDGSGKGYQPRTGFTPRSPSGKTVELVLRSTPPGATASIDGRAIGVTPTFWSGPKDNRAHDFTFVKDGHTMARYRFVATHSGVVHGNLAKLQASEEVEPVAELP